MGRHEGQPATGTGKDGRHSGVSKDKPVVGGSKKGSTDSPKK